MLLPRIPKNFAVRTCNESGSLNKPGKLRADVLLVERGLAESRNKAQALIMAGLVFSGERRVEKPGDNLSADAPMDVRGKDHPWVSRGGIKLAHALERFQFDLAGSTCVDIGASTGGFTDVMLQQRRAESLRDRRRSRADRVEIAAGQARRVAGKHQCTPHRA